MGPVEVERPHYLRIIANPMAHIVLGKLAFLAFDPTFNPKDFLSGSRSPRNCWKG